MVNKTIPLTLRPIHWLIVLSLFICIHIPAVLNDDGHSNQYTSLAKAFCSGQTYLSLENIPFVNGTNVKDTGDLISYQGRYYLPYPPAPALLLIPFVHFNGGAVNTVLIALLLSCLNIFLLYSILRRLSVDRKYFPWLISGFIFGTSYWYVLLTSHHVYGFAEVISVTCLFLTLNELFGKKRSLLIGLYLGLAFLSRQFTILIALFVIGYFIYFYLKKPERKDTRLFFRKVFSFSLVLGVAVLAYLSYNYIRFGSPFDSGYRYIAFIGVLRERVAEYGVFSSHYLLYNLYNYLFRGFHIDFTGEDMLKIKDMDLYGTALLIASPFLIASFKTGWHKFSRAAAWIAIGLIFTGLLFYHNNGKDQVNASRFTLDFLPLMMVLAGLGAHKLPSWLFKGMVLYSILINVIAMIIHLLFHTILS